MKRARRVCSAEKNKWKKNIHLQPYSWIDHDCSILYAGKTAVWQLMYKNNILKCNYIQTVLFFKYIFSMCYWPKTFNKLCYFSKINKSLKSDHKHIYLVWCMSNNFQALFPFVRNIAVYGLQDIKPLSTYIDLQVHSMYLQWYEGKLVITESF
jgi:hypothetical protein